MIIIFCCGCLVLTTVFFFESAKDFRAGLENKDMFSRHQWAQEYLKKAKEAHQAIVVRSAVLWFVHDGQLSLLLCPAATYPGPILAGIECFKPTQDRIECCGRMNHVIKTRFPILNNG